MQGTAQGIRYERIGQSKGLTRIPWGTVEKKLRGAAAVWLDMRQRSPGGINRSPYRNVAKRLGISERSVEHHARKLRRVGLLEDGGRMWRPIMRGAMQAEGWVHTRTVHGVVVLDHGVPVCLMASREQEQAILGAGSGGARKGAGNPKWVRKTVLSNAGAPLSNAGAEPLSNAGAEVVIKEPTGAGSFSQEEKSSAGSGAAPDTFVGPEHHPRPAPPTVWPRTPPPQSWDRMPKDPDRAAQWAVRLFADYREVRYGKRLWWRGDLRKQKWWASVRKGVAALREAGVPVAKWVAWADGAVWAGAGRKGPPPPAAVFSEKLVREHLSWFQGTADDYFVPVTPVPPSTLEAWNLWTETQKRSYRANRSTADETQRRIEALAAQGDAEAVDMQERLAEAVRAGRWAWQ